MKKATDEIVKRLHEVDFIIEVLDARGISVTSNSDLKKIINQKPILRVALKSDLSDLKQSEIDKNILIGNIKQKSFRKIIIDALNKLFSDKINRLKAKGLVTYQFIGMVVGIPNIGKSSLINFLSQKNELIVQNRAGVTKKQATKKINQNFYLIDTPGILFKKIENIEDGYKLSILHNIAEKVLPIDDILKFHYNFLIKNYEYQINKYFEIDQTYEYEMFITYVCNKYKFITKNNELDLNRAYSFLFKLFTNSEICPFHY